MISRVLQIRLADGGGFTPRSPEGPPDWLRPLLLDPTSWVPAWTGWVEGGVNMIDKLTSLIDVIRRPHLDLCQIVSKFEKIPCVLIQLQAPQQGSCVKNYHSRHSDPKVQFRATFAFPIRCRDAPVPWQCRFIATKKDPGGARAYGFKENSRMPCVLGLGSWAPTEPLRRISAISRC